MKEQKSDSNPSVKAFAKEASLDRLKQIKYVFQEDKAIVKKIQELKALIDSYN